jgi:flavorubredoxin
MTQRSVAEILFSGDVGAALEPPETPMFVDDFSAHASKMKLFHQRWMPSETPSSTGSRASAGSTSR